MITNTDYLVVYHKTTENHNDIWTSYVYKKVWCFEKKDSNMKKGFEDFNRLQVRIPYITNSNSNIRHFDVGDIIVKFKPTLTLAQINELKVKEIDQLEVFNLARLSDVVDKVEITNKGLQNAYDIYYITSVSNNVFGTQKHIHLEAK